jgi:hypothetical protein
VKREKNGERKKSGKMKGKGRKKNLYNQSKYNKIMAEE